MSGTGDHHVKWNKPAYERQTFHVFSHMWYLDLKKKDTSVKMDFCTKQSSAKKSNAIEVSQYLTLIYTTEQ
jgi:hypothetical protein